MKKVALLVLALVAAGIVLSKLPSTALARTIAAPTPTPAPVVSPR